MDSKIKRPRKPRSPIPPRKPRKPEPTIAYGREEFDWGSGIRARDALEKIGRKSISIVEGDYRFIITKTGVSVRNIKSVDIKHERALKRWRTACARFKDKREAFADKRQTYLKDLKKYNLDMAAYKKLQADEKYNKLKNDMNW